ncbi:MULTISPECIES: FAD-dependent monooxygenase [unclassified Mycobacterium]|uniref:FAD-dependent monooxygenase n=1 Tax=unclassified Mycobacterium TaxID=2642494 RepID=UPI0029C93560|nr:MULTISPECIES: FAD-dependent monooxygenase [unclassified Mycobacterium]
MDASVLIVGAGPTGLVLAAELARRGVMPRVIDAGPSDVRESRAVAVVARSLEILDDLGIAAAAIEQGVPLRALNFYDGATLLAELDVTAVDSPFPMDLCIAQWQTTGLLREKVAELGVTIEWNTRLAGYQSDEPGVRAQIIDRHDRTETFETEWLVGCDGTRSTVRETAGIGWETDDLRRGFVLGDFVADWTITRDRFHVWFAKRGLVAVFPMPGGYWRALVSTPGDSPPHDPQLTDFAAAVAERTPLDSHLRDLQWSSSFVAGEGLAAQFRRGRVLLAGDAAHSHSPIGGQGMNTGMQDAYNLGWKLALVAADGCDPALLDSYEAERRPVAVAVINATTTATRVATGTALVARRARRHALRFFSRFDTLQKQFSNAIGEHLVDYHDSTLVRENWFNAHAAPWSDASNTGPAAGKVAPDGYVETRSGPVAMRHIYRGPGHHLVLFAADESNPSTLADWQRQAEEVMAGHGEVHMITRCFLPTAPTEGVFADIHSDAHNRYGVRRPSVYVIRPDKYVGYRDDTIDFAAVHEYIRVFGSYPETRVTSIAQ